MKRLFTLGNVERLYTAVVIVLIAGLALVEFSGAAERFGVRLLEEHPITVIAAILILILGGIGLTQRIAAEGAAQTKEKLNQIDGFLREDTIRRLQLVRAQMLGTDRDPLLGPEIDDVLRRMSEWVKDGHYEIAGRDAFQVFWTRNIRHFTNAHIRASALADPNYFFDHDDINNAIRHLVNSGGSMERIFFVKTDWKDDPRTVAILDAQLKLGVWVCTIEDIPSVPQDLCDTFFLFDAILPERRARLMTRPQIQAHVHHRFGWRVLTARRQATITRCRVYWNSADIAEMEKQMDRLRALSTPYREEDWHVPGRPLER